MVGFAVVGLSVGFNVVGFAVIGLAVGFNVVGFAVVGMGVRSFSRYIILQKRYVSVSQMQQL